MIGEQPGNRLAFGSQDNFFALLGTFDKFVEVGRKSFDGCECGHVVKFLFAVNHHPGSLSRETAPTKRARVSEMTPRSIMTSMR